MSYHVSTRRSTRKWQKEPSLVVLVQRPLWMALKEADISDVPNVLREHFSTRLFTSSSKGELSAWMNAVSKCNTWLRRWLSANGTSVSFNAAFIHEWCKNLTIPSVAEDRDVLLVLRFLSCVLEHSRNKGIFGSAVLTVSIFLNSPSVDIVHETLMVLHWYAASQRQRQQPDFDISLLSKLVALAAAWGHAPSLLQSTGLEPYNPAEHPDSRYVTYQVFKCTYDARKRPAADPEAEESDAKAAEWVTTTTSPSGEVTITVDLKRALEDEEGGPVAERPCRILQYVVKKERLSFQHTYPLWTRLRMAAQLAQPEQLRGWAVCRMLSLAVTASANEEGLKGFLQHCSDWFQDVTRILSDENAPCAVVTAVLQLLSVLLSSMSARDALNSSDLRGTALSPSTLAASQGRLLEMIREAPKGMSSPKMLAEDGSLLPDAQNMYTALFGFASVFAVNQGQPSAVRTLNTVIVGPLLQVPRLRIPGTEKVAAKCLSVIEHLLGQADTLKEQVIEAGCTALLIDLMEDEVMRVSVDAADVMETDFPVPEEGMSHEELRYKVCTWVEHQRRIPHEREVVLAHLLRACALCIGSSEGVPSVLFANVKFRNSLKRVIENPVYFGHSVYKLAVHAVSSMMHYDHAVCPAVLEAGVLDAVLHTIKSPPADPRFTTVLPQLLVAFSLSPKGTETIKSAGIFTQFFLPLRDDRTWCAAGPSEAADLGSELNDLMKSADRNLMGQCSKEVFTALTVVVDSAAQADWSHPSALRHLHILQHHVRLLMNLKGSGQGSFTRQQLETQATIHKSTMLSLLTVAERMSHVLVQPTVALDRKCAMPPGLTSHTSSLSTLHTDLLHVVSNTGQTKAMWEVFTTLGHTAAHLSPHCFDVTKWEEPAPAPPTDGEDLKVSASLWPAEGGPQLALHQVATCAHLLSLIVSLEEWGDNLSHFLQPLVEMPKEKSQGIFRPLIGIAIVVKRWQVARMLEKRDAFERSRPPPSPEAATPPPDASKPQDDTYPGEKFQVATAAAIAASLIGVTAAQVEEDLADPVLSRRGRIASMFSESCLSWIDVLCKAVSQRRLSTPQPEARQMEIATQLSEIACTLIRTVREEADDAGTPLQHLVALFSEVVLGPWCRKILSHDVPSRRVAEPLEGLTCPSTVYKAFSEAGGVDLLTETCSKVVQRVLEGPPADPESELYSAAAAALRLLAKFSASSGDRNAHYRSYAPSRHRAGATEKYPEIAKKNQDVVASHVFNIWKHPRLQEHPAMAGKVAGLVGHLVKVQQGRGATKEKAPKPKKPDFEPDENIVTQLADMGFSRSSVLRGLRHLRQNSVELVTDWLLSAEGSGDGDGAEEADAPKEDEVEQAIAMSLQGEAKQAETDPLKEFVDGCSGVALGLGRSEETLANTTTLLCLLTEAGQRDSIATSITDTAKAELAKGYSAADKDVLFRSLAHLFRVEAMRGTRTLAESSELLGGLIDLLEKLLQEEAPAEGDAEACRVAHWRLGICIGSMLSLMLAKKDGEEGTGKAGGEWEILTKTPNEPIQLPPDVASRLVDALCQLVGRDLPANVVFQAAALLDNLTRANHSFASRSLAQAIPCLLSRPVKGSWPHQSIGAHVANLVRSAIEDPEYVTSVQESTIRKTFSRIVGSSKHASTVEHVPVASLYPDTAPAELGSPLSDSQDVKRKKKGQVPLVKLQTLMTELQATKNRHPELFMKTLSSCCRLVLQPKGDGSKPEHYMELRPAAREQRSKRMSTRRKAALHVASDITGHILKCIDERPDEEIPGSVYALSKPMLVRLVGELVTLYPSVLPVLLEYKVGDKTLTQSLLHDCLPYSKAPQSGPVVLSSAARFVLLSIAGAAAESGQLDCIVPDVMHTLSTSVEQHAGKGVGAVNAVADLVVALLSRKGSSRSAQRSVASVAKELIAADVANVACAVLQKLDLNHPDVSLPLMSLLRIITNVAERRKDDKQGSRKEGRDGADLEAGQEAAPEPDAELDEMNEHSAENLPGFSTRVDSTGDMQIDAEQDGHIGGPMGFLGDGDHDVDVDVEGDVEGEGEEGDYAMDMWEEEQEDESEDMDDIEDMQHEEGMDDAIMQMMGTADYSAHPAEHSREMVRMLRHQLMDLYQLHSESGGGPRVLMPDLRAPQFRSLAQQFGRLRETRPAPDTGLLLSTPVGHDAQNVSAPNLQESIAAAMHRTLTPDRDTRTASHEALGGGGMSFLTPTQVSYSADAVQDAVGAYLRANAPASVVSLPEPAPATPASVGPQPMEEDLETSGDKQVPAEEAAPDTPAPPAPPAEVAQPAAQEDDINQHLLAAIAAAGEGADEGADGLAEELRRALALSQDDVVPAAPAAPAVPDVPAAPAAPAEEEGMASDDDEDSEMREQLAAALAMSAAEADDVQPPAPTEAAPAPVPPPVVAAEPEAAPAPEPQQAALDPTFVAALPEEIRGEVLRENIQLLMTRPSPGEDGSTVDTVFLDALPAAIRTEVLEYERRILRQRAQQPSGVAPAELDAASFMATLQPELRQEILQTSGEEFIRGLPSEMVQEAQHLRESREHTYAHRFGGYEEDEMTLEEPRHHHTRQQTARAEVKVGKQLIDLAAIPHLLRVLYLEGYGSKAHVGLSAQCGMKPFAEALNAVTLHPPSCRAVFSSLLYILSNGKGEVPKDAPGAQHSILTKLYGTPVYLSGTTTIDPPSVPPIVMLRAMDILSRLAPLRSPFFNVPTEEVAAVLMSASDKESRVAIARSTVLSRLLELHSSPAFGCSPKLSEALMQLVQTVAQDLCSLVEEETLKQATAAGKTLNRKRVQRLREWAEPAEQGLMSQFDVAEDDKEGVAAAFKAREAHHKQRAEEVRRRRRDFASEKRGLVEAAAPTATQHLAAELFAHPPTLRAMVKVLETADTTTAAVNSCLVTLNAMCAARLPATARKQAGGVSVGKRLLEELLEVAKGISSTTTDYLEYRTQQIQEALKAHLEETGGKPTGAQFFISDDPPSHEVKLQRLTRTLAAVSHHDHLDEQGHEEQGEALQPSLEQLQGKWRSHMDNVAHVRQSFVVFEGSDGSLSDPAELQEVGGELRLFDHGIDFFGGRWIEWQDGDVWRRDDEETQLASYVDFKNVLSPLWGAASTYLAEMETVQQTLGDSFQPPPRVLPLVEALFAFHEIDPKCSYQPLLPVSRNTPLLPELQIVDKKSMPITDDRIMPHAASTVSLDVDEQSRDPVKAFAVRYKKLLNALIKKNASLLETSLRALLGYSSCIDFHNKRNWFRERIKKDQDQHRHQTSIKISRSNVFHDSFLRLRRPAQTLKGNLRVTFKGEEGVDGGGLKREWFQVLAKEMFNPDYALFIPSEEGNTFQPNPNSSINQEHLSYFNFVGRVVGLAVYSGVMLDAYFTRSLYKHMLGITPDYRDIQSIEPEYYKSLLWILENDPAPLDHDFTIDIDNFGKMETVELCEDGKNTTVSETNKHVYVQRVAEYKTTVTIKQQLTEFLKGFFDIIPRHLIKIFSPEELELLICGTPDIDIADWKANTDYVGYTNTSPQVRWFWQVVDEMEHDDRLLLMQFITGSSKVPLTGFKDLEGMSGKQRFNIHRTGERVMLPASHTCFNQLDLPEYDTFEMLKEKLEKAVFMGHVGFGFI